MGKNNEEHHELQLLVADPEANSFGRGLPISTGTVPERTETTATPLPSAINLIGPTESTKDFT